MVEYYLDSAKIPSFQIRSSSPFILPWRRVVCMIKHGEHQIFLSQTEELNFFRGPYHTWGLFV